MGENTQKLTLKLLVKVVCKMREVGNMALSLFFCGSTTPFHYTPLTWLCKIEFNVVFLGLDEVISPRGLKGPEALKHRIPSGIMGPKGPLRTFTPAKV